MQFLVCLSHFKEKYLLFVVTKNKIDLESSNCDKVDC